MQRYHHVTVLIRLYQLIKLSQIYLFVFKFYKETDYFINYTVKLQSSVIIGKNDHKVGCQVDVI